jgi:hypothetical protein
MTANNSSRKGVVKKTTGVVVHSRVRRSEPPVAEEAVESEDSELSSEDDKKYLEEEPRTRAKKRSFAGKLLYLLIRINSKYQVIYTYKHLRRYRERRIFTSSCTSCC